MTELPDGGVPAVSGDGGPPGEGLPGDAEGEPIELLVQLAEDGEIDPWDIDIVRVTDKFLSELDRSDLRTSGRALFYASVLLRMKSDALLEPDEPEEPDPEPWEQPFGGGGGMEAPPGEDPIASLEGELDRRLDRKRARGTPETLDELVRELRDAERESWWKESRTYDTTDSPRGFDRGTQRLDYRAGDEGRREGEPTAEEVTGATHAEDIQETVADVRAVLDTHYDAGRDEVLFGEVDDAGGSRVETFLAVLFLSHRGEVTLEQDEFFGDLWVREAE
ncbi:MAG: segregation/condensation protein A [Halobacteriales archaeon]